MNHAWVHFFYLLKRLIRLQKVLLASVVVLFILFELRRMYGPRFEQGGVDASASHIEPLQHSFCFCGRDERPDRVDLCFHLLALSNGQILPIKQGEKRFLCRQQNRWSFSADQQNTPEWVECMQCERDVLTLLYHHPSFAAGKGVAIRLPRQVVRRQGGESQTAAPWTPLDCELQWYGEDLFLREHGLQPMQRESLQQKGHSFASVAVGEALSWKEGAWQRTSLNHESQQHDLMVLKERTSSQLEWILWRVGGFESQRVQMQKQKTERLGKNLFQQWSVQQIHVTKKATVIVQKQMEQIQAKDWWLHTQQKWKKLATAEEIEKYAMQQMEGELYVCEGIALVDGKYALVGHLFNKQRNHRYRVLLHPKKPATIVMTDGI